MHVRRVSRGVLLPGKIKSLYLTDMLRIRVSVNEQALRHQRCRVDFQKRQKKKKKIRSGEKKLHRIHKSWATYFLCLERQFPIFLKTTRTHRTKRKAERLGQEKAAPVLVVWSRKVELEIQSGRTHRSQYSRTSHQC